MTRRVRSVMLIGAVLAGLLSGVASAQDKPADQMDLLREKARADKRLVVAEALALTEGEAKAFWPVYNAYQSDMVGHYDKVLELIDRFSKAYDSMTDDTAIKLLNDYLALEASHVALLKSYVPRFQKASADPQGRPPLPGREQAAGARELRARPADPAGQVSATTSTPTR